MNQNKSSCGLIYSFEAAHPIGVVCDNNCKYCPKNFASTNASGEIVDNAPLVIIRESNIEEWKKSMGPLGNSNRHNIKYYYYEVSTD